MLGLPARTPKIFLLSFILNVCFLIFFRSSALAAIEVNFSTPPNQLEIDQPFNLDITISGATNTTDYYIRGAFFQESTPTSYFGYTKNNVGIWHNLPSAHNSFFKTTGNGTWNIEFKVDPASSAYKGLGEYKFKVGRYTTGGSLTWSNQTPATITLIETTPSPSPSISPTPSPSPTNSPIPTITASPTPSPTFSPLPTPSPQPSLSPKILKFRLLFQHQLLKLQQRLQDFD